MQAKKVIKKAKVSIKHLLKTISRQSKKVAKARNSKEAEDHEAFLVSLS